MDENETISRLCVISLIATESQRRDEPGVIWHLAVVGLRELSPDEPLVLQGLRLGERAAAYSCNTRRRRVSTSGVGRGATEQQSALSTITEESDSTSKHNGSRFVPIHPNPPKNLLIANPSIVKKSRSKNYDFKWGHSLL